MASKERHADIVQDVLTFLPDDYIIDCVRPRKNTRTFEDIYCIKVTKDLGPDHELASDSARDGRDRILEVLPPAYRMDCSKIVVDPSTFEYINSILIWVKE